MWCSGGREGLNSRSQELYQVLVPDILLYYQVSDFASADEKRREPSGSAPERTGHLQSRHERWVLGLD